MTLSVVPLTNLLAIVVLLWHSAGKIAPLYKSVPPPTFLMWREIPRRVQSSQVYIETTSSICLHCRPTAAVATPLNNVFFYFFFLSFEIFFHIFGIFFSSTSFIFSFSPEAAFFFGGGGVRKPFKGPRPPGP